MCVRVVRSNVFNVARYDKLDQQEIKDLLASYLFIVSNLPESKYTCTSQSNLDRRLSVSYALCLDNGLLTDVLLAWFANSSELDVIDFFEVLQ